MQVGAKQSLSRSTNHTQMITVMQLIRFSNDQFQYK